MVVEAPPGLRRWRRLGCFLGSFPVLEAAQGVATGAPAAAPGRRRHCVWERHGRRTVRALRVVAPGARVANSSVTQVSITQVSAIRFTLRKGNRTSTSAGTLSSYQVSYLGVQIQFLELAQAHTIFKDPSLGKA